MSSQDPPVSSNSVSLRVSRCLLGRCPGEVLWGKGYGGLDASFWSTEDKSQRKWACPLVPLQWHHASGPLPAYTNTQQVSPVVFDWYGSALTDLQSCLVPHVTFAKNRGQSLFSLELPTQPSALNPLCRGYVCHLSYPLTTSSCSWGHLR